MRIRSPRRLTGLLTAGLLVAPTAPASAQSLGDVARRTEAQRQAQPPDSQRVITNTDVPHAVVSDNREVVTLELTMPMLQRYAGVRTAILREMVKSPEVAQTIRGAIATGSVAGVEEVYASEPSVVRAIETGQMTTHEYVVTGTAFMAAVGVLAGKLPASAAQRETIGTNVEFLRRHQQELIVLWQEAFALDDQLARALRP